MFHLVHQVKMQNNKWLNAQKEAAFEDENFGMCHTCTNVQLLLSSSSIIDICV